MDRVERHRARLKILVDEAGGQPQLAKLLGTANSYISQLLNSRQGIARKFCERLERATNKPDGWMDQWMPQEGQEPYVIHDPPAPYSLAHPQDDELIKSIQSLPDESRQAVRTIIESLTHQKPRQ